MSDLSLEALFIFFLTYISIIVGKISHTVSSLLGGMLMIIAGIVTQDMAIKHFIDFNTIGLLLGMMIIISIVRQTGFLSLLQAML